MGKVSVFVDASNFYHIVLKKLGIKECNFNFDKFANFLSVGREFVAKGKRFYVGTVREGLNNHENKKAISNQTKLFTNLKSNNWEILTSKLRTRKEVIAVDDRMNEYEKLLKSGINEITYERSREKGIDVQIAVDLIIGAMDSKYDTAIVVSSDTDLVPAIDAVRKRFGKKVEYIGFSISQDNDEKSTRPTKRMIYNSDIQRVLAQPDLESFIIRDLFTSKENM